MEFIAFLDEHDGFFMALLTFVYVVFTILIFISNNKSVKEMKLAREEEYRPFIVSYIQTKPNGTTELIIENIGKTVAKNVEIEISPEFNFPKKSPLSNSFVLNNSIPNMPPNYRLKFYIGSIKDFKIEGDSYQVYEVWVKYHSFDNQHYKDNYTIDFNIGSGGLFLVEKDIHDLTKEFIEFRKKFNKLQSDISYIKNNFNKNNEHD